MFGKDSVSAHPVSGSPHTGPHHALASAAIALLFPALRALTIEAGARVYLEWRDARTR